MQLFSADTIVFSKEIIRKNFDPKNMKKPPSKDANNPPPTFFYLCTGPAAQTAQKQKSRTIYHQKPLSARLDI